MQLCGWIAVFELPECSPSCCGCLSCLQSCVAAVGAVVAVSSVQGHGPCVLTDVQQPAAWQSL
jgi:hypothetical protein